MSTEFIIALIKANIVLGVLLTNTILLIWFERKLVAGMQSRVGPDRAGPFGILQTVADAIKLMLKEQILPLKADRAMYLLAPIVALVPSFLMNCNENILLSSCIFCSRCFACFLVIILIKLNSLSFSLLIIGVSKYPLVPPLLPPILPPVFVILDKDI